VNDAASDTVAALAEWVEVSDSLMRGLVHALNNRITALSAFAELAVIGDAEFTPQRVLPGELDKLLQVNGLFRLLLNENLPAEALELGPLLEEAVALHGHHARLRAIRCDVVQVGTVLPLRVPRWALLRLLLVMMESAKRSADSPGPAVTTLRVTGEDRTITLRAPHGGEPSRYAAAMAELCGGSIECDADEMVARLPTLPEIRRGERGSQQGAS
jgi:hypothetical protein